MTTLIQQYAILEQRKREIDKKIKQVKAQIIEENKPNGEFGTFNYDGFQIVIPKKVEWDQDALATLVDKYNFIKTKYDVSETLYKALPDEVKEDFEAHRTVKQGTYQVKVKNND